VVVKELTEFLEQVKKLCEQEAYCKYYVCFVARKDVEKLTALVEVLGGAIPKVLTSIHAVVLVAQEAHLAMPRAKLISMELSDFRALRELGKAIQQLQEQGATANQALAKARELVGG
jgi:hypothetical protein